MRQRRLHREEHRGDIGLEDLLESFQRGRPEWGVAGNAGIGKEDVELAEFLGRAADGRLGGGGVGYIQVSASAFGPNCFAAASSVSLLRPVIVTFAPSATNSLAVARPMPLL